MTYFLILLPALALAAIGALLRRRSPGAAQALILLGCIGSLGVMVWQVRQSLFQPGAKPPDRAHSIVSFYLANQAMRDTEGRSGTVVLLFPPRHLLDAEAAAAYANAFEPLLLRGHPELKVESITLETPANAREIPAAAFKQVPRSNKPSRNTRTHWPMSPMRACRRTWINSLLPTSQPRHFMPTIPGAARSGSKR